ncbi:MAG: bifunctional acetate--CoA ligase family protein/GNAT family N-acetyltransferase [Betaproteobacteria bacterium]
MSHHFLQPLLAPRTVAMVGASDRTGSLGNIVLRNLAAGGLERLDAVNPKHRQVAGLVCYASLGDLPVPAELAVIATPARTVPRIVAEAGQAGIKAAVVLSSGFGEAGGPGVQLQVEMLDAARQGGVRLLGPNCLGVMRTDCGLNATFARTPARRGKLALVSQSGAICGAILDWAESAGIGFTSVVSLGGAADVDFGEVLDFLVGDGSTEAILLYVEGIRDARRFMSALRAAARVKPVVVLKAGRHASGSQAATSHTGAMAGSDAVFEAALRRSGTVRVKTYTQLFAAAKILAAFASPGRVPKGNRLAIVTNGGGPGVMAADCATDNGVPLAVLSPQTIALLDTQMPAQWSRRNPIDIIGDASASRFRDATAAALAEPGVDAVLAMYSPVAVTEPEEAARAVAEAAAGSAKPVLAAWLGDIRPGAGQACLEDHGIPNFYTPENAVEAFSYLGHYVRNQAQLMEVPAASVAVGVERTDDLVAAVRIFERAAAEKRAVLTGDEAEALAAAFGLPVSSPVVAASREAATAAAASIGFPVVLKIHSRDITHKTDVGGVRLDLRDAASVAAAFDAIVASARLARPDAAIEGVGVEPMLRFAHQSEVLVGVSTDPVFGPVIAFGSGGVAVETIGDTAVALPPLNLPLALDLIGRTRVSRVLAGYRNVPACDRDALAALLCSVSRMVCALPWIREMDFNPVLAHPGGAVIADARVVIDPLLRASPPRYGHMAIHPYPAGLEREVALSDGTRVLVRPIRPDDVALEQSFFDHLSQDSRYQRFMHYLPELPPRWLARFTQLDYGRELALVALLEGEFIGVGRYSPDAGGDSAEFALAVADRWQGKGLGRMLLGRLREEARKAGYRALRGEILNANHAMIDLASRLGFTREEGDGTQVSVISLL